MSQRGCIFNIVHSFFPSFGLVHDASTSLRRISDEGISGYIPPTDHLH
jgi:hypothetical protein